MFSIVKNGLHRTIRALRNIDRGSMRGSELLFFPYAHARPRPRTPRPRNALTGRPNVRPSARTAALRGPVRTPHT